MNLYSAVYVVSVKACRRGWTCESADHVGRVGRVDGRPSNRPKPVYLELLFQSICSSAMPNPTSHRQDSHLSERPPRKRQKLHTHHDRPNPHKPAPKPNAKNPLKSRLRSVTRLLAQKSSHMPADQLLGLQREEESLRSEIASIEKKEQRSRTIAKYHKIRFFERKKAQRRLSKAEKQLRETETKHESATEPGHQREEVKQCEVDLKYTLFYPLEAEYVRLYQHNQDGGEAIARGDMWNIVKKASEIGRLEELREGTWLPAKEAHEHQPSAKTATINSASGVLSSRRWPEQEAMRTKAGLSLTHASFPGNTYERDQSNGDDIEGSGGSFFGDD